MSAYDSDFHGWTHAQADALRRRSANEIDWENVAEEIESLGRQQVAELTSRLEVLLVHLLKWAYQPERQGRSWTNSIAEQRRRIERLMRKNPSLKSAQMEAFDDAYEDARHAASIEITGESDPSMFPQNAPFTAEQALTEGWTPEPARTAEPLA